MGFFFSLFFLNFIKNFHVTFFDLLLLITTFDIFNLFM
jgi:hypothetical protein